MYPYIKIFGRMITTYGLCMTVAFAGSVVYMLCKTKKQKIPIEDIIIITVTALGFSLLGGKLVYILVTFSFSDLIRNISMWKFGFLINGGIVFYGGLFGGIAGAVLGSRIAGVRLLSLESSIVPYLPIGHAIGRIGCLLAGCCYGMEYNGIGAIHYAHSIYGLPVETGYFPVQPMESICDLFIAIYLSKFAQKNRKPYEILYCYLFLYAIVRFILEFLRGDVNRGIYYMFSTAQWISLGIIMFCIWKNYKRSVARN